MTRRAGAGTLLRFLAVGVINTLVGLLTIYAMKALAGLADAPANGIGYGVGLACSFVLNRRWTFAHTGPRLPALLRFGAVFGVAYGLNLATVMAAIHGAGIEPYLAQALGIPPYTLAFYLGSRYFAFASRDQPR